MITRLSHTTIYVDDQEAALRFYTDTLGFEVRTDVKMDNGRTVKMTQETRYPWEGSVKMTVKPDQAGNHGSSDGRRSRNAHASVDENPEPTSTIGSGCVD